MRRGAPNARRQAAQLVPKMRFVAAQFKALYSDSVWRALAQHANGLAQSLARNFSETGVASRFPVEANMVFAEFPSGVDRDVAEEFPCYELRDKDSVLRFVTSRATTDAQVAHLSDRVGFLVNRDRTER